jgi:hypothetical protein
MRLSAILILSSLPAPLMAASPPPGSGKANSTSCPRTTQYLAGRTGVYRGNRLTPRKLTELPPATGYMAVYRTIDGCEAPLTVVEYRQGSRR